MDNYFSHYFLLYYRYNPIYITLIQIELMGNATSSNDDFSKNPNFNLNQHRNQMQTFNANYIQPNLNMPHPANQRPNTSASQYKQIKRTCSIYKPSFNIHQQNQFVTLEFEYDSDEGSLLEVYIEVDNIIQHQQTLITVGIESKLFFQDQLMAGKKKKFKKLYPLQGKIKRQISTIIVRVKSSFTSEITEYSLRFMNGKNSHWKVLLQKFQLNNQVTQLHNIYKTDQNNDCIICLSQKSQILIEPCNHLCICNGCIAALKNSTNKCPICRNGIGSYKIILSKNEN